MVKPVEKFQSKSEKSDELIIENMYEPELNILELTDKKVKMDEPKLEDDEETIIKNKDHLKIDQKKQIRNRKHYLNTEKKFHCDKCSFSGKFISNLKVHIESVHDSITHPCDNCGQRFSQKPQKKSSRGCKISL